MRVQVFVICICFAFWQINTLYTMNAQVLIKSARNCLFKSTILYQFLINSFGLYINQTDWKKHFLLALNELISPTCSISSKARTKFIFIAEFLNSRSVRESEGLLQLGFHALLFRNDTFLREIFWLLSVAAVWAPGKLPSLYFIVFRKEERSY